MTGEKGSDAAGGGEHRGAEKHRIHGAGVQWNSWAFSPAEQGEGKSRTGAGALQGRPSFSRIPAMAACECVGLQRILTSFHPYYELSFLASYINIVKAL